MTVTIVAVDQWRRHECLGAAPRRCGLSRRTLIVTRGLPGSGKTTKALRWVAEDPEHRARVGSDEVAEMLHPHALAGEGVAYGPRFAQREQLVVHATIEALLQNGIDVVCDDPFLLPQYLDAMRELVSRCRARLVIWDLTAVDVEECIVRDKQRGQRGGRTVGERNIRLQYRLYRRYFRPAAEQALANDD